MSERGTNSKSSGGEFRVGGRFRAALQLAAKLHEGQSRKGTSRAYIGHLIGVASIVFQYGGDEDEGIAALLHDSIEDQGDNITFDDIRAQFGERVARIVAACTDSFETPKPPWEVRKQNYVAHVKSAAADERLVSAADKLYNVREIILDYRAVGEAMFERFNARRDMVIWYYQVLAREYLVAGGGALAEELERTVREFENLLPKM